MKVEKSMTVAAPIADVWEFLLDPKRMAASVPGTQSVEELSETEYRAVVKVKISFISATFKVKTTITEQDAPRYLRCEGAGEDSKVASSMKHDSELFLAETDDGGTEIKVKADAQVFGRLGSFGLSVMKTKIDRLWKEFGENLRRELEVGALS